jgi:SAM-dependent methyltransferase
MKRPSDILNRFAVSRANTRLGRDRAQDISILDDFIGCCKAMNRPRVLELGTKRSIDARSTRHDHWVPHAGEYLGTDIENGADVDFVADAHRLTTVTGTEQFDVIISCSTFEHFKYPHLAAHEVMKALRVGGIVFIQTHQSFPLHGHPHDYFRFSREALAGLFGTQMGFRIRATDYEFPVKLCALRAFGQLRNPAFLNVRLFGEKVSGTPPNYVFECDDL